MIVVSLIRGLWCNCRSFICTWPDWLIGNAWTSLCTELEISRPLITIISDYQVTHTAFDTNCVLMRLLPEMTFDW